MAGCAVREAAHGEAARALLDARVPRLMLLDDLADPHSAKGHEVSADACAGARLHAKEEACAAVMTGAPIKTSRTHVSPPPAMPGPGATLADDARVARA